MEKVFNKLVRDNIPEIIISNGDEPVTRVLDNEEYKKELLKKLVEEAKEVESAQDKEETLKEIADVYEVVSSLLSVLDSNYEEIKTLADKKRSKNGGFEKRIFLEKTFSDKE